MLAFIFADLIILPILDIYRRYYGWKMMWFLLTTFYATMATAGLIVEFVFQGAGLVPHGRHAKIEMASVSWNYTTVLNIIFLLVAAALSWRYFRRGGGWQMLRIMNKPSTATDEDPHQTATITRAQAPPRRRRRTRMNFSAAPDQPWREAIRRVRIRVTRGVAAPYYPTMAWRSRVLLAAAAASLAVAAAGLAAAAPNWPGPPRSSAPQVAGTKTAPPPAWVETLQHSSWLGYSSYCWSRPAGTAACVDFLPPRSRTDLPVVSAHAGSMLRFHLQFATSELSVSYPDKRTQRLKPSRIASWLPLRSGIVTVSARSASGQEASYLFRLTLTPPSSQATAAPGPLQRGKWVCSPRSSRRACAGPVTIRVRYLYVLRTHCGILDTYFAGRLWRANPALTDGSGNPPRGWENPEALGTMRLVRANLAEFRQDEKRVARFTPAPPHWKTVTCD